MHRILITNNSPSAEPKTRRDRPGEEFGPPPDTQWGWMKTAESLSRCFQVSCQGAWGKAEANGHAGVREGPVTKLQREQRMSQAEQPALRGRLWMLRGSKHGGRGIGSSKRWHSRTGGRGVTVLSCGHWVEVPGFPILPETLLSATFRRVRSRARCRPRLRERATGIPHSDQRVRCEVPRRVLMVLLQLCRTWATTHTEPLPRNLERHAVCKQMHV